MTDSRSGFTHDVGRGGSRREATLEVVECAFRAMGYLDIIVFTNVILAASAS